MEIKDKKEFITNFMNQMRDTFLAEVYKYPDNWDGTEIRWYIAGAFESEAHTGVPDGRSSRKRRFNNDRLVRPLKY